jgi:hypothetical protein
VNNVLQKKKKDDAADWTPARLDGHPQQDHTRMHRRAEGREAHDKEDEGSRTGRLW